jgi:TIR domain
MRLFISYARANRAKVEELQQVLEKAGHEAWFDEDITAGEDWWNMILNSIERCEVFVFALSPQSTNSDACRAEFQYAIDLNRPIFPVMLAESELPVGKLRETQYVDATRGLTKNEVILDLSRSLLRLQERITKGEYQAPNPLPPRPAFPFTPDPLTQVREKVKNLQVLSRQEIIEMVYDIKQVARANAKLTQESREILQQIVADPHVPQGVVAEAQEVLTGIAAETKRSMRMTVGGAGGIVILILAFVLTNNRSDPILTLTPNTPSITPSVVTTPETTLAFEAATLENLNAWREQNGYAPLSASSILVDVADGQMRYLSTLPLPDLEGTNLYVNADGRDAQWMANNAGYNGNAQMFVAALPDGFTFSDLLTKLEREGGSDVHSRYNEAGLASMRSEVTSVLYFVLILGQTG